MKGWMDRVSHCSTFLRKSQAGGWVSCARVSLRRHPRGAGMGWLSYLFTLPRSVTGCELGEVTALELEATDQLC